jgi:hypothetical protein
MAPLATTLARSTALDPPRCRVWPRKECVDIQVRVAVIDEVQQVGLLATIGFRCRPEPWNRAELSGGQECRVPRRCNVPSA